MFYDQWEQVVLHHCAMGHLTILAMDAALAYPQMTSPCPRARLLHARFLTLPTNAYADCSAFDWTATGLQNIGPPSLYKV